jgi:hypothetical protein
MHKSVIVNYEIGYADGRRNKLHLVDQFVPFMALRKRRGSGGLSSPPNLRMILIPIAEALCSLSRPECWGGR